MNLPQIKSPILIIGLISLLYGQKTEINIYNIEKNELFEIDSIIVQ